MDRRLFLMSSVAGIAAPVSPLIELAAPAPGPVTSSGDEKFDAWSKDFVARAAAAGWPEAALRDQLKDLTFDPAVIDADHRQPEVSRSIGDYMRSAVSDDRLSTGRQKRMEMAGVLAAIQAKYGVASDVLIGIWALESNFGAGQGEYDVIRSLATLAADGRRRDWAEGELYAALRILLTRQAGRGQLKGSWAGAMGQTQLEPSVFLTRAVDGDGDGKADIWGSAADALASAANILGHSGWLRDGSWAREVLLPQGFDYALAEGPRQPPAWWADKGVRRADGAAWGAADQSAPFGLIVPAGAGGPAFLVGTNHFVIRTYNNSTSYALAVGLIADGIAGATPVSVPWPAEPPLSRDDRFGAQQALAALGYDVGEVDGVIGLKTRAALRAWQTKQGLPADGHLTPDLAAQLQQQATTH